jgi:disulfide bond formation protein DsbB
MGHREKAKKVILIALLASAGFAALVILIPEALGRLVGLGAEAAFYFLFSGLQDREFDEWQAAHQEVVPTNGWRALGWGFIGVIVFLVFLLAVVVLLGEIGIPAA